VVADCTAGEVAVADMVAVVLLEEEAATAEEEEVAGIADLGLLVFDQAEGGSKTLSEAQS
jgi:hypothetical protein